MSFPRYPKYKDSGVEWLGEVPEHWEVGSIKYFVLQKNGAIKTGPFGSHLTSSEMQFGTIKVYNQRSVIDSDFDSGDNFISEEKFAELISFETFPGDLLITTRGTIGRAAILPETAGRGILHPCLLRIQPDRSKLNTSFLKKMIQDSDLIKTQLSYLSNATTIDVIYSNTIASVTIPVPPIGEQSQIESFLDTETAKIDELVAEQRRLIELLKEKRQAVISHAVTKGLNPNVPLRPSGIEWLGDVPEHWAVPAVFTRYQAVLGKMLDEKKLTGNHPIPYLRNADVNWDHINVDQLPVFDIKPDERERFSLRLGDILICEGGAGVGQTAIWNGELAECSFQKALHRLRPWSDDEVQRFFYYCMRNAVETGVVLAGGTATIPHLTGEQLRKYRFPRPPVHEQRQLVEYLDKMTDGFDDLITEAECGIELLQERRTALISAAVTGKIDVRGFAKKEGS